MSSQSESGAAARSPFFVGGRKKVACILLQRANGTLAPYCANAPPIIISIVVVIIDTARGAGGVCVLRVDVQQDVRTGAVGVKGEKETGVRSIMYVRMSVCVRMQVKSKAGMSRPDVCGCISRNMGGVVGGRLYKRHSSPVSAASHIGPGMRARRGC